MTPSSESLSATPAPMAPSGRLLQEHDGPRRPGEHRFLLLAHEAQRPDCSHRRPP